MTNTEAPQTDTFTYVIPCGAAKADHRTAARDLYTGSMFRHTLAAAVATADADEQDGCSARVLILSALHGLVELDTELDPYNVKMGDAGCITPEALAAQAVELGIGWGHEVYAMLPKAYLAALDAALRPMDVNVLDVYEAAPGIGYQRGVNKNVGTI